MEIQDYPDYLIYDDGRVYSKKRNRFLKQQNIGIGYKQIGLCSNGIRKLYYIHRLIALHYIPNPENKKEVDHLDRDPSNNHISNLRWTTPLENSNNKGNNKSNKSGVKNVCFHTQYGRWSYSIMYNGKTHRKCFKTFEEAVEYKREYELNLN